MASTRSGRIILVRHGETEANLRRCFADSDEMPLTDAGRRQSRELALRLAHEFRPQVVVSSHFLRARQTSEILAGVLNLATEIIPGIHERDFGRLKGQPYDRLAAEPDSAESLEHVGRRALLSLEALRLRYPGQELVVVTHGAVIQALCVRITGQPNDTAVPPNCGVVTICYEGEGWSVKQLSSSTPDKPPE